MSRTLRLHRLSRWWSLLAGAAIDNSPDVLETLTSRARVPMSSIGLAVHAPVAVPRKKKLIKNVTLHNGVEMPIIGFGVFQIADDAQCETAVRDALQAGYRHLDTAASYMNERAVGRAIKSSGIPRQELFITTKLWLEDAGEEATPKAFSKSLEKLGLEYLDLYLIHQPFNDYYGAWRAMENLYRDGAVRAIGVSNFYPDRLMDLVIHNDIAPMVNQIETHPFYQRESDQDLMRSLAVQIESWGPFAEGRNDLFSNPTLAEIGRKYGKSIAQVTLRWLTQRDVVVIPKSVHLERMAENIDVFDFTLTPAEMDRIATLDTGASLFFDHRTADAAKWLGERHLDL